ncbi:MAG TPA: hypothetical protein VFY89_07555, partial [Ktedonobacterales bacterium]
MDIEKLTTKGTKGTKDTKDDWVAWGSGVSLYHLSPCPLLDAGGDVVLPFLPLMRVPLSPALSTGVRRGGLPFLPVESARFQY